MNTNDKRWITITTYVDVETGEVITKSEYERKYYKVKTNKKTEENEKYRIKKFEHECRETRQGNLWD